MSVLDHPCVSSAPSARLIRSVRRGPARGLCVGCVGLLLSLHAMAQRTDAPVSPQESDTGLLQHWPSEQVRETVLQGLVKDIVQSHPLVQARRGTGQVAAVGVDVARLQYWPSLTLQSNPFKEGRYADTTVPQYGVNVTQPLWTAGRLSAGLSAAESRLRSSELAVVEAQYNLATRIVDLYQGVLGSQWRQAAMARNVSLLHELNDMVKRRIEREISPRTDGDVVAVRLAQARNDLVAEQSAERTFLSQLSTLAGKAVAIPRRNQLMLWSLDVSPQREFALLEQAKVAHVVLRRYSEDIEAAMADILQQRAAAFPTVSVQVQRNSYTTAGYLPSTTAFLSLQYQPGAGLSSLVQAQAAVARADALRNERESVERDILQSLLTELQRARVASERRQDALYSAQASGEIMASTKRLFLAGRRGWLDVVNIARDLVSAELAVADIAAALEVADYRLRLLSGDFSWQRQDPS
jgi:adhesin transport system outer membrane protein